MSKKDKPNNKVAVSRFGATTCSTADTEKTRSVEREFDEALNKLHRLAGAVLGGADYDVLRNYSRDAIDFVRKNL